ncbi:nucleoside deaminase [Halovenus sp. HT40]|jgi:tRNA(Arg) A34 adenosine deaminase TadA|uniref:nucleoside deaminase n=1 Tax=Halovenus sp. HT40 TaxID=3126691 RepID=UPI00300EBD69
MVDEQYIREAIELAEESVEKGNTPFGSLLVIDDEVVRRSRNTTVTEADITAHPELKLARWAARELDEEERANCTMYTSTEPCEMCSTAVHYAELDRVVFSVSTGALADLRGTPSGFTCAELIEAKGGEATVEGPILEAEGLAVHEQFD